jgi:intracellular multiplication protein IcmD
MYNGQGHSYVTKSLFFKLIGVFLVFFAGNVLAGNDTLTLGGMAKSITGSFESVTQLITAASYLAGLGFGIGAIIKFKAHKDQPQQVPIGQPIGLVLIASALLFFPTVMDVAGNTLFGPGTGETASPTGMIYS